MSADQNVSSSPFNPSGRQFCTRCGDPYDGQSAHGPGKCAREKELFTVQVQGRGVRLKARVPGWVAAMVFSYAKENEA